MNVHYHLIDGDPTGGNDIAAALARSALDRGWEVTVTAPRSGTVLDDLSQAGARVRLLDPSRTHRLDAIPRFYRLFKRRGIDISHVHGSFAGNSIVPIAARLAGLPSIVHAHVTSPLNDNPLIRAYQLGLHRVGMRACDAWIAVSNAVRREFEARGAPPETSRVVHNGVEPNPHAETDPSKLREELDWPTEAPIVVQLGRLTESKGQHVLARATPHILDEVPGAHVYCLGSELAGDGYRARLEATIDELGIGDRFHLTGFFERAQLALAAADVVTLPSTAEGLPLVVLEAMAAGTPVVATDAGGTREALVDGETGLLLGDCDPERLAQALTDLLADRDRAQRLGGQGLRRYQKRFTRETMVEATFDVYDEVLESR